MSVTASLAELLRSEVGVADPDVRPGIAATPEAIVHPATTEEVAATMRLASAHGVGVLVVASAARLHPPAAMEQPFLVLCTDLLSGMEIYEPADTQSYLGDFFPIAGVERCRRELEQRADLTRYSSPNAADDLETVRRALG